MDGGALVEPALAPPAPGVVRGGGGEDGPGVGGPAADGPRARGLRAGVRLAWIEVRDFRNHERTHLEVPGGLVVAVGGNGEGKTNLLEAMYYGLTLSSPRVSSDLPLVRRGAQNAYVRCEVEGLGGRALIEVEIRQAGANRVQVNRSALRRKRDIHRAARAVFFSPGDLEVVQGNPDARRSFLDEAVGTLWPAREPALAAFDRALRQRNRLLKDWEGPGEPPGLQAWDEELVRAGAAVTRARADAVARVAPPADEEFRALTGYGLDVRYVPSVQAGPEDAADEGPVLFEDAGAADDELTSAFRRRLRERRTDELARRVTLVGPHRDELELGVRELVARSFASHGEAWAAALALRLGQARAVTDEIGEHPVLLLDDPFPGLDPVRQARLSTRVSGRGQTVLSVADEAHVPEEADEVWDVAAGRVTPRGAGPGGA